jgi:hypothetical protein
MSSCSLGLGRKGSQRTHAFDCSRADRGRYGTCSLAQPFSPLIYEKTCATSVLCFADDDDAADDGVLGNHHAAHRDDRRGHMHGCRISAYGGRESNGDADFDGGLHRRARSGRHSGAVRHSCTSERQAASPKVIKDKAARLSGISHGPSRESDFERTWISAFRRRLIPSGAQTRRGRG